MFWRSKITTGKREKADAFLDEKNYEGAFNHYKMITDTNAMRRTAHLQIVNGIVQYEDAQIILGIKKLFEIGDWESGTYLTKCIQDHKKAFYFYQDWPDTYARNPPEHEVYQRARHIIGAHPKDVEKAFQKTGKWIKPEEWVALISALLDDDSGPTAFSLLDKVSNGELFAPLVSRLLCDGELEWAKEICEKKGLTPKKEDLLSCARNVLEEGNIETAEECFQLAETNLQADDLLEAIESCLSGREVELVDKLREFLPAASSDTTEGMQIVLPQE